MQEHNTYQLILSDINSYSLFFTGTPIYQKGCRCQKQKAPAASLRLSKAELFGAGPRYVRSGAAERGGAAGTRWGRRYAVGPGTR